MPTLKYRVNLAVPSDLKISLQKLAKRDRTSVATTTLDLVRKALEIEEDLALLTLAKQREKTKGKFISHKSVWG
jgi:hypothetical protein